VARETRKIRRAQGDKGSSKPKAGTSVRPAAADPLPEGAMKSMIIRLSLLVGGLWVISGSIAVISQSPLTRIITLSVAGVITLVIVGVAIWAAGRAKKAKGVAGILAGAETAEGREAALSRLDKEFKSSDPAAVFAKAQLQMQEDPKQALVTLEQIDLVKVSASVADEARAQRAMIHLMLGEVSSARDLADGIDLSRHQDARSKAMMSSVIAEAWARSGQAKRALKTIELFNPEDDEFEQLRPQLYRARAFVFAYTNNVKKMRSSLRKMAQIEPRMLGAFMVKKTHPLLQKEVRVLLEKSGAVQRKVQFQRG
jgi:hypothetical protein